jgi:hypothetical protein
VALYVMLSSLSESGRKVLRQRPGWIRKVNRELEALGAKVRMTMPAIPLDTFISRLQQRDKPGRRARRRRKT